MVFEVKVRIKHNCPFLEFSSNFGKRQVHQYCGEKYDYLIIPGQVTDELLEQGYYIFENYNEWKIINKSNPSNYSVLTLNCKCNDMNSNSVTKTITNLGGMPIFPIIYENGWENHKIFCHSHEEVSNILNALNANPVMEITSINDLGDDSLIKQSSIISQVLDQLTEKQSSILIKAFENGYYEIPRQIRIQDIADELGITRYAVERTVRSAENKLIRSLMPYLYIKDKKIKYKDLSEEFQCLIEPELSMMNKPCHKLINSIID